MHERALACGQRLHVGDQPTRDHPLGRAGPRDRSAFRGVGAPACGTLVGDVTTVRPGVVVGVVVVTVVV